MVFTTREQVKPTQLTVSQRYCANGCDSCPVREGCYSDAAKYNDRMWKLEAVA